MRKDQVAEFESYKEKLAVFKANEPERAGKLERLNTEVQSASDSIMMGSDGMEALQNFTEVLKVI